LRCGGAQLTGVLNAHINVSDVDTVDKEGEGKYKGMVISRQMARHCAEQKQNKNSNCLPAATFADRSRLLHAVPRTEYLQATEV
jgi:hypothetical protein